MADANEQIVAALQQDLAEELAAITQYMWHHIMAKGPESISIAGSFRTTSLDEMRHAELLATRLDYFDAVPTTVPANIKIGGDLRKMVQDDLEAELGAIERYKAHIGLASEAGDPVTRIMLEQILVDEEKHAYLWRTVLDK